LGHAEAKRMIEAANEMQRAIGRRCLMSFSSSTEATGHAGAGRDRLVAWFLDGDGGSGGNARRSEEIPRGEAQRMRLLIETAIGGVFGVCSADIGAASRGKAPVALARQAAMYLAHVSCGMNLTDVGAIFGR